jgi:carboxylesterase
MVTQKDRGMRIGFEERKGETGVLLLHGLSGTPDEVKPLGDYLANRGLSTLAPWLKGHGTSPEDLAETTWLDWVESAQEALNEIKTRCSKVFVAGLSMGALTALHLARHQNVAGLVSLAAPLKISDFRFNGIAFFRFLQWRTSELAGGILNPQAPPHQTYPYVATRSLYELKKFMDTVREELSAITVPALIAQGRKDSMVPPVNGEILYRGLGSMVKYLFYLERSNHVVTMDFDKEIVFEKTFHFIKSGGLKID